ncbi:hypothetical protein FACS1894170_10980 [Planctomycetales bacterium]|nr:hypothetical protein FACS1894170_10980 [Planctomycetales bacterium]
MDFHTLSPQERLLLEHVLLLNREVRTACQDAPYGYVLDAGEQATVAWRCSSCKKSDASLLGFQSGCSHGARRSIVLDDASIWKSVEEVFYQPNEVLFGEGTEEFNQWWKERARTWWGIA